MLRGAGRLHAMLLAVIIAMMMPRAAAGQDLEPRSYANLPIGLNFLLGGYGYTQGNVATDPSVPITDAKLHSHTAVVAYARSINVFGMSAKIDAVVPYTWLSGQADFEGQPRDREVAGFNDPKFRFTLNFLGAPALSMADFVNYHQDVIVGASVQVSVPIGQYDSSKAVNIGTNRWSAKPELGFSKAFGRMTVEIAPSVTFYGKNDNYLGGKTREQKPLYAVQGHVIYGFDHGIWASIDATYYTGGRSSVEGRENDNLQQNWRLGGTLAMPIDRRYSIKFYGSTGVATRTGGDYDLVGVVLQYRWGAGL